MSDIDTEVREPDVRISRRRLLKASALALATAGTYGAAPFFGPWKHNHVWAQAAQKKPLVIGLTMDASGQYAASGMEERLGAMMAIKEFNAKGGVLGRTIEAIHMDTETTPATGSRVAERLITRNEAAFLIGALHSGVANAISQVAQKYGCVYLNTNSSSPTESGKDCHRVKFVWDGNGTNFALAIVKNAMAVNGKNWVMLTNDYVWGHQTSKAMRTIVEANGGKIVDELMVPQNTRDFSSYLIKIQQIKPSGRRHRRRRRRHQGAAPAGRPAQAEQEPGVDQQPAGLAGRLRPRTRSDLRRVRHQLVLPARPARREGVRRRVPEGVPRRADQGAGQRLLQRLHGDARAAARVERAGSTNNIKVIKELEGLKVTARDRMQDFDAYMNPATHQMQQTIYMATYNDQPAEKDDIFKILAKLPPKDVEDPDAPRHVQARGVRRDADVRDAEDGRTHRRPRESGDPAAFETTLGSRVRGNDSLNAFPHARDRRSERRANAAYVEFLANLVPHLVNGLSLGLLFALIALGFMLIVGVMETINLAHGSFFALGMYVALMLVAPKLGLFAPDAARPGTRAADRHGAMRSRCSLAPLFVGVFGMLLELCDAPHVRHATRCTGCC